MPKPPNGRIILRTTFSPGQQKMYNATGVQKGPIIFKKLVGRKSQSFGIGAEAVEEDEAVFPKQEKKNFEAL